MSHSLDWLLRWSYKQWSLETPTLNHSVSLIDEGGAPKMKGPALVYLNLAGKRQESDDWWATACRVDEDGFYQTPLRCSLAGIRNEWVRNFLHDLIPNAQLSPSTVATIHGVPEAVEAVVMQWCLSVLHRQYQAAPYRVGWVSQSESQRNAIVAGEAVA